MKYKSKKIVSLLLAFSLVFAAFAPVTSAKAQNGEAAEKLSEAVYEMDTSYPEADEEGNVYSALIPAEAFTQFDGPVALELEFEKTGTGEWPGFGAITAASTPLTLKGNTSPWAATESLTVMLEEEQVELAVAEGGLLFQVEDMYFTRATLREATPDDAYVGDWNKGYEIPASELESYTGNVALVIDYRVLEENPYTWCNFSVNEVAGWRKLSAEEYAFTEYEVDEDQIINVPAMDSKAVVVLPEETVAKLVEKDGLVIQVYGIIVEEVTVISAISEDEFTLSPYYPEPDDDGNVVSAAIPAEALLSYGGNVAFTLDYVTTGTVEHPYAVPRTHRWTELTPKGNTNFNGESGTVTFVLETSDIATAIAEGGILFQLDGVYFTRAKLSVAEPDDYYAGDWNAGYKIGVSELSGFTGEVVLSIRYRALEAGSYIGHHFSVAVDEGWEKLTAEDFSFSEYEIDSQYGVIYVPTSDNMTRVVLTEEAVAKAVAGGGLVLQAYGLIIEDVTLIEQIPVETEYELDSTYPEADADGNVVSGVIPAGALAQFNGPVALTLDFETIGDNEWPSFFAMTPAWTSLDLKGNHYPWSAKETLTVVLEEAEVAKAIAEGGIMFQLFDVYFTKVVLSAAEPDDYYVGDWNEGYRVSASEFSNLTGDVTFVVDYRPLEDDSYTEYAFAVVIEDSWNVLSAEEYSYAEYSINEYGQMHVSTSDSKAVFTLPKETVAKLVEGNGLLLQVMGIVVENMTILENAEIDNVFELDSSYPEANENGGVLSKAIPAEGFVLQNGPVAITLDFVATGENEWPGMNVFTAEGSLLYAEGNTYPWHTETGKITLVLDEKDVNRAIAEGGVVFGLDGVYFTQAEVRPATQFDYYVGDWNTDYTFYVDELATVTGDVAFTVEYLTIPEYDWYGFDFFDEAIWTGLTKEDYVTDSCLNEYDWVVVDDNKTQATVTLKGEAVQRVIANGGGLGISVYGLIIEDVTMSNAGAEEDQEGSLIFLPTQTEKSGYGYTTETLEDGALAVAFEAQYQEIRFHFPEAVDLSVYNKLVVTLETTSMEQKNAVVLKVIPTDAELDQYDNPTPVTEAFGVVKNPAGDVEVDLSEFADKKIDRLAVMASEGACNVNVYRIVFMAEENTIPDVPELELGTLPEGSLVLTPAEVNAGGYGYEKEASEDGALAVSFDNQYSEIQFNLSEAVDLSVYDKLVMTVATTSNDENDSIAIKMVATDAEIDEWDNLSPFKEEWGVVKYPGGDVVVDLSEFANKKVNRICIMANNDACDVFVYRIAFLPKEGGSTTPDDPDTPSRPDAIDAFVTRMYRIILEREPDAGSSTWVNGLRDGSMTGVRVADGFVLSEEMLNKDISNEDFVKILYRAFFGREADADGLATWKGLLDAGCKKTYVFAGFANSTEFGNLCAEAGIVQGRATEYLADRQTGLSEQDYKVWCFVERMYTEVLGRTADEGGVRTWVGVLQDGSYTGVKVAKGFLMSEEFLAKNMTNEEYVRIMYRAFFGRDADPEGLATWTNALATGWTKQEVFAGFANSGEFGVLCEQAGIVKGTAQGE